jgi:histidinol phosphatase-like enzyme (inositol monophosphatase family)
MNYWQSKDFEVTLLFARNLVFASSGITLKYFRKTFDIRKKPDESIVTIADEECEMFIGETLQKRFPGCSLVGEEFGEQKGDNAFTWYIDPIDGTINYSRGLPFWGTLLALEVDNEIVLGILYFPAMEKTVLASKGRGCFDDEQRLAVSSVSNLSESTLVYGYLKYFLGQPQKDGFMELARRVYDSRGWGDCYGYATVIGGNADIMIDPRVGPWDVAPMVICIEEAGGRFSDYKGDRTIHGGNAVVTNGILHDEALEILNSKTLANSP